MTASDSTGLAGLSCEYQTNPLGIDADRPRFGWRLVSDRRGAAQSAYRLRVAPSRDDLAGGQCIYDTGRVEGNTCANVRYAGEALAPARRYWWDVEVWDERGQSAKANEPAWFEMGLPHSDHWRGQWIGAPGAEGPEVRPAPFLRKAFRLKGPIAAGRVYICGLGYHELHLNGDKVGDHELDPGFTRFDKRALYVTHDVTDLLDEGENALGVILGNGFYNQGFADAWHFNDTPWRDNPKLLCELRVTYADGTTETIVSDDSWRVAAGPIVFDATRSGEHYDARKAMVGWDRPGYDDSRWAPAAVVKAPAGVVSAQFQPPMRVTETFEPVAVTQVAEKTWLFDMGRNVAGWAELRVEAPAGTEITLRYGEKLDKDGRLDQNNLKCGDFDYAVQTDCYICAGEGEETWRPRFCYHGYQFVEVEGLPAEPTTKTLRGMFVHTDFATAGAFECSNELLNTIQQFTRRSFRSNFHSIPTDCPHREKNGWTGDALLACETGLLNFETVLAYEKWMNDFFDEQRDSGALPGIVPTSGWGYDWGNGPCWDSAYVLIPWWCYLYTGDTKVLEDHYGRMVRYIEYLIDSSHKLLVSSGLGDWVPPYGRAEDYVVPAVFTLTGYFHLDALVVSKIAAILGKDDDARQYAKLAQRIAKRINDEYYDQLSGTYSTGSQTAQAGALFHDVVPPRQRKKVVRQMVASVKQFKYRPNVGIHGAKFLLNELSQAGHSDVAFRVATAEAFPSWGWWIDQGATSLWENWNGQASRNHIMYGDISAWMFKYLAGIRPTEAGAGFARFVIAPHFVDGLDWVRCNHQSPRGPVEVHWQREGGRIELTVVVPPNAAAEVELPSAEPESITESGGDLADSEGVTGVKSQKKSVRVEISAGRYVFSTKIS